MRRDDFVDCCFGVFFVVLALAMLGCVAGVLLGGPDPIETVRCVR